MLRLLTAVLALAATGLATCPGKIGKGAHGWVKATACGAGSCGKSIELPLEENFKYCNPCTGEESTELIYLEYDEREGRYEFTNASSLKTEASPACGLCDEETGLFLECPASKCPAKIGNGKVTWTGCGVDVCARPIQLPVGEEFTMCDPCTGEVEEMKIMIEVVDSMHYRVTGGGESMVVACGKCNISVDMEFGLSCPSNESPEGGPEDGPEDEGDDKDGLSGGAITGIAIGCFVLVAAVAGGVFVVMRRKKEQQEEQLSVNYAELPHSN